MTSTAYTVPDDPPDPEAAALELIVRLPSSLSERLAESVRAADNIIDEIGRAHKMLTLKDKVLVMKAARVKLLSNINPVYELLDPDP